MQDTDHSRLSKSFIGRGEVKGYSYEQLRRDGIYAVYSVDNGHHYEVIRIRFNKRFNTETYPSSKRFGIDGFTYLTLCKAYKKYLTLINNNKDDNTGLRENP